jgi:hypothetical protein
MSQRNQGLARDNNLSEPIDDGQAINNLAGAGVDQDLFIFINNLNNTSELTWDPNGSQASITTSSTSEIQNNEANNGGNIGAASSFSYSIGGNFNAAFEGIEANVDVANFKRVQKYSSNASVASDRDVKLEGVIRSADPDGANDAAAKLDRTANPQAPGVYITDPFSDITNIGATRAFSTSANPWSEATGKLTTPSEQVNIGNLLFADGIEIDGLSITTASGNVKDPGEFTHKLGVNIDGVEYFLCLGPA